MNETDIKKSSRRIIGTLFADQSLISAGNAAVGAVTTIMAAELSGGATWAGLPGAVTQLAAALAAYIYGHLWGRIGRRYGIALGFSLGTVGMLFMFFAVQWGSFAILLLGNAGFGFARSAIQMARFTAADVSPPTQRGRAISYVVLGGTVGAIFGPLIAEPTNQFGMQLGLAEWAGPFLAGAILVGISIAVTLGGLRPEPSLVAREVEALYPAEEAVTQRGIRPLREILQKPVIWVAISATAISQTVMIMVMRLTSLYMKDLSYGLGAISIIASAHMVGMFAFSIFTGQLADRWGRVPVIITGIGILMVSFVLAPMFPTVLMLAISLYLLGLGWNLCFVGGSALLSDQLSSGERARTQGFNDLFLGLTSAGGSIAAGFIFAAWGYGTLNLIAAGLTLIPLVLLGYWKLGESR